jgi:hypothetical protein
MNLKLRTFIGLILFSFIQIANATEVAFAGFAYSGDNQSISDRFPYSERFQNSLGKSGVNGLLMQSMQSLNPANFTLISHIDDLTNRDQAISVAFVVTNETVTVEPVGKVYKLFAYIRGQALFFDFKTKTVLRSYPFGFAYLDALYEKPSDADINSAISYVYLGKNGKQGLIDRFKSALTTAALPTSVSRYVQVSSVEVGDEAKTYFPSHFTSSVSESWLADTFSETIADKMSIPILPYSKGYAIGNVMSMTVSDGSIFNLKLPEPDYKFSINLTKLKKVTYEETEAGKSLIYGAFANIKLEEPLSGHVYLDDQFKNGETKVVSAMQVTTEDFPAFQDSIRGLFNKLSDEVAGRKSSWLKSASTNKNIDKQIISTRELLKSCK